MSTPWFERKKRLEVVEPEDETKLEDDTNVPLWRAMFKKLRFSECLILIWVISGSLLGFCNEEGGGGIIAGAESKSRERGCGGILP